MDKNISFCINIPVLVIYAITLTISMYSNDSSLIWFFKYYNPRLLFILVFIRFLISSLVERTCVNKSKYNKTKSIKKAKNIDLALLASSMIAIISILIYLCTYLDTEFFPHLPLKIQAAMLYIFGFITLFLLYIMDWLSGLNVNTMSPVNNVNSYTNK